jgi:hypothetical protein
MHNPAPAPAQPDPAATLARSNPAAQQDTLALAARPA